MRTIELRNNGSKLAKQLLRMVDSSRGRNYQDTHIQVRVEENGIVVGTFCVNDFGSAWCNQNHTRVAREKVLAFITRRFREYENKASTTIDELLNSMVAFNFDSIFNFKPYKANPYIKAKVIK